MTVSDYVCTLLLQTISCQLWLCTTTSANTLIAVVHLTIYTFSPITSIYLLFSMHHYLLPFHPLTNNREFTNDTLHWQVILHMAWVSYMFTCSYSLSDPFFFTIIIMVIISTHVAGSNWVNMGPMKHQLPFLNNTNSV